MSYIKGTTSLSVEANICSKMGDKAKKFPKLEGYTRGWDGTHLVTMLQQNEASGVLVGISYSTDVSNEKNHIGHANDCTYYDGIYYVVEGGSDRISSKKIKRYNMDLTLVSPDYEYSGTSDITCIAHIKGDYFFLGKGEKLIICKKNDVKHTFDKVIDDKAKVLFLPEENTVLSGWIRQGMCCKKDKLYKVYGTRTEGRIRKNYIAKFRLSGTAPFYEGISLHGVYACNREGKYLFEAQSIDVSNTGQAYIAIDRRDTSTDHDASIYQVTFKD